MGCRDAGKKQLGFSLLFLQLPCDQRLSSCDVREYSHIFLFLSGQIKSWNVENQGSICQEKQIVIECCGKAYLGSRVQKPERQCKVVMKM